jgi:hypothetical protein
MLWRVYEARGWLEEIIIKDYTLINACPYPPCELTRLFLGLTYVPILLAGSRPRSTQSLIEVYSLFEDT